jgi:UDP-N-acetylglucosamine 2-epimerase (non-hydrolysing)
MMVGLNPERILQGLIQLDTQKRGDERSFRNVEDYSMPNVSDKVVRIIVSYVDYIKRVVWSE